MTDPQQVAAENVAALNAHDEARLRATYADDAVMKAPGPARLEGGDAATEYVMVWLRAFPDARQSVENKLVAGDWVVQEFTFTGTHTGTLASPDGDIPPTHRSATGHGVQIQRIAGDRIAEERVYFDQVEILTQLGLLPEPTTA
jgi:predicted ester cyclase